MDINYNTVRSTLTSKNYYARYRRFITYEYEEVAGHYFRRCIGTAGDHRHIAFLGAAQVFGCHVDDPFPSQTARGLDVNAYNVGVAGAGPGYFLSRPELIDIANACDVVVLQIMSGSSVSFPGLTVHPVFNAQHIDPASGKLKTKRKNKLYFADKLAAGPDIFKETILRMRTAYVEQYKDLIRAIRVPVVPIWTSAHEPGELPLDPSTINAALGSFPQLVDIHLVEAIEGLSSPAVWAIAPLEPKRLPLRWRENCCSTPGNKKELNVGYYLSETFHKKARELLIERLSEIL
ncbi:DUF6473 family protein [Acuticoccus mangrovi]|uniref:DUF6473 domain-containing protein n=1 Tax=Acuticoccus mangrovi TaxID=2796142 RepID=A0A934MM98_9HYPH|nr:DUF6473 family protein [Acuticoccus mangrovi]MBJ3777089.1 hypothetical protein [Acuticoccus mangrovi]